MIRFKIFGGVNYDNSIAFKYESVVNKEEFDKNLRYHSLFVHRMVDSIFEDRYGCNKWQTLAMENSFTDDTIITRAKNFAFLSKDDKTKSVISELLHEIHNLQKDNPNE